MGELSDLPYTSGASSLDTLERHISSKLQSHIGEVCVQGVVPATLFLDREDLETHELGHASLSKLILPIINSGTRHTALHVLQLKYPPCIKHIFPVQ